MLHSLLQNRRNKHIKVKVNQFVDDDSPLVVLHDFNDLHINSCPDYQITVLAAGYVQL